MDALPPPGSLLQAQLTGHGTVAGTPKYMAPEQTRGESVDAKSDQYSFCRALHEALFSAPASSGVSPTPRRVLADVAEAIQKGLSENPADRHPSMAALLAALTSAPQRRRRRRAVALGVGVLVAGAAALTAVQLHRARICRGGERRLAGVWDNGVRSQLRTAFTRTGHPNASATWSSVESALDQYANQWVSAQTEACEATRLRGEQSEAVLRLRSACLDSRLASLRDLTQLLASATAQRLDRAPEAALNLRSTRDCADVTRLQRAQALEPKTPEKKDAALRSQRALDQARTLDSTGATAEAMKMAQDAVVLARAAGHRGLEAEALEASGWYQHEGGDYRRAAETLNEATITALAGDNPEAFALAATKLLFIHSERFGDLREARRWAARAGATLERLVGQPATDADVQRVSAALIPTVSQYLNNLWGLAYRDGTFAEARPLLEKAVALRERSYGADHPETAKVLNNLGIALASEGDYAGARALYARCHRSTAGAFGPKHPYNAMYLLNLGETWSAEAEHRKARETYEQVVAIWSEAYGPAHVNTVIGVEHLAGALLGEGDAKAALSRFEQALAAREKLHGAGTPLTATARAGVGRAWQALGDRSKALANLERAVALGGGDPEDRVGVASTHFALAQVVSDATRADRLSKQALELLRGPGRAETELAKRIEAWRAARTLRGR
jgi:tetratricopeptide (TPR) repeat protein